MRFSHLCLCGGGLRGVRHRLPAEVSQVRQRQGLPREGILRERAVPAVPQRRRLPGGKPATRAAARRRRCRRRCSDDRSARQDSRASTASASRARSTSSAATAASATPAAASAPAAACRPPAQRRSCTLEPIYFDFNESVLTTEATAAIDRDADCIKKTQPRGDRSPAAPIRAAPRSTTWRSATSARSRSRIAHGAARRRRRS